MIKITFRIIIILLAAALVSAGLYALVQNGSSSPATRPESGFNISGANNALRTQPGGREGGERNFNNASLGRGLGGMLVTLLQIGAITFVVLQFRKTLSRPRRTT
jgi:hypothetical protein